LELSSSGTSQSERSAWYGVAVLMFISLVAILDRQILNLLVDPIRSDLDLSDIQIGVLQGPAFMVFYTLFGFPLGWMVDRMHRLRLLAAGIALWTAGTIGCGLAVSYEALVVARAVVGMGEAVASPASISLIADYFRPDRRPIATSVYGTGAMFGTGLALLGGGLLLSLSQIIGPVHISGLPTIEGWRFAFVACGLPGIVGTVLALSAKEPVRQDEGQADCGNSGLAQFLFSARAWILTHFSAVCLIATMSFAFMSWLPSYLIRGYGWQPANVGVLTGVQFLFLGPAGILAGGFIVRRMQRNGLEDAAARVLRQGAILIALSLVSMAIPWSSGTVLLPLSLAVIFVSMLPTISLLAIQQATPGALRGRMAAIYFITTNLVGYSLGPIITAALNERVFTESEQLGYSLGVVGIVLGPLAALLFSLSLRHFRRIVDPISQDGGR
jgi:MFS family permease